MAVWGYARGSVRREFMSVEEQKLRITSVYPEAQIVVDDRAGARPAKFLDRPNAAKLNEQMQRGDTLVIASLDRGFRTLCDFILCYDLWRERGIRVIVQGWELSDEEVATIRALAEWERLAFLDRNKEKMAYNSHRTSYHLPEVGHGFRYVGKKRVPDPKQRKVMAEIVELAGQGYTWYGIAKEFTRRGYRAILYRGRKGPWTRWHVERAYNAEVRLRAQEEHDREVYVKKTEGKRRGAGRYKFRT